MPWYKRPAFPALLSLCVAVAGALLAALVKEEKLIEITVGVLAGVAALQVGELWQFHARTPRLTRLEEVLTDEKLYAHVEGLIDFSVQVHGVQRQVPALSELFSRRRDQCLLQAHATMQGLGSGRIRIEDPDAQYKFAVDLVAQATKSVRTVSYRDEEFWTLAAGEEYLKHNAALIRSGGVVERVFVFDDERTIVEQRPNIEAHLAIEVNAWILPQERLLEADREDFVIYDDCYVRHARSVESDGSKKEATLDVNESVVVHYCESFENLKLRSVRAEQYFAQLDGKEATSPELETDDA